MSNAAAVADQQLSTAIREGSAAEHEAAETSDFTVQLLAGRINAAGYTAYLQRLHTVYAALEDAVRARRTDPAVAAVYDPAVERRAALEADLDHWAPGAPYDTDSPAAAEYAARLRSLDWGGDLLAHHYTRYLGDLSGGRTIGRVVARSFDLDGAGVAFYSFPEIAKPKPYKDAYRARVDELDLSAAEKARVVDEVKVAFGLNQAVFDELGRRLEAYLR